MGLPWVIFIILLNKLGILVIICIEIRCTVFFVNKEDNIRPAIKRLPKVLCQMLAYFVSISVLEILFSCIKETSSSAAIFAL